MKKSKLLSFAFVAIASLFLWVDLVNAQPGGRGGFNLAGMINGLQLTGQESVQKELELTANQIEDLNELRTEQREEMGRMMREAMQGGGNRNRGEGMERVREEMEKLNKEFETDVNKVLLPHQKDRLKQLVVQSQSRMGGGVSAGRIPDALIKELDITDEQLEKLQDKAREVGDKLAKKIADLQRQAEMEVLGVLSPAQQKKFEELVGDSFDFGPQGGFGGMMQGRAGRGGDGGGRGGRGGDGGGRGGRGGDGGERGGNDF